MAKGARGTWSKVKNRARRVTNNEPLPISVKPSHVLMATGVALVGAYVFWDMGRSSGHREGSQEQALAPTGRATAPTMLLLEEQRWADGLEDANRAAKSAALMEEAMVPGSRRR